MRADVRARAASGRAGRVIGAVAGNPSIDPSSGDGTPLWAVDAEDDAHQRFREIDCVRRRLAADAIAHAEQRAARLGVGADRVLIASGALDEESYLRALGESAGVPFDTLNGTPRADCPLDDDRLIEAAATGLLPLEVDGGLVYAVAPRGVAARKILAMIEDTPAAAARFRFTTAERFNRFVLRSAGQRLAAQAAGALNEKWPELSAASSNRPGSYMSLGLILLLALAGLALAPGIVSHLFEIGLAALFVAWLGLRLIGACVQRPASLTVNAEQDDALPVYSVICALYQEASSVNGLLAAIQRLDYPALGSKCTKPIVAI